MKKIDIRFYLLCAIALAVLSANFLFAVHYKKTRSEIEKNYISELKNGYEMILGGSSNLSNFIYNSSIDTPEVKRLFAQGALSTEEPAEKDRYRKLLYDRLLPLYESLKEYNFRQLHFHEKNNVSYLRFHRPGKYGDDLTGIRYSVGYVNREKKYISGFEEGRIFNGYRFVYPLFYKHQHIGSVEISVSMGTIFAQLGQRLKQQAQFIILKSQVEKKVFKSEISKNYVSWFADESYFLDQAISKGRVLQDAITAEDTLKIKEALATYRETSVPFCVEIKVESAPVMLTFLPVKNIEGKKVAYIFTLSGGKKLRDLDFNFYSVSFLLLALFALLIIFTVYYRFSQSKIEKLATFDSLTKVYVRGIIMGMIKAEYQKYKRYQTTFSLIMLDIDHFKAVNDNHGHTAGDIVLAGITEIMKKNIRETDSIGRYGGEEFIVLLPETNQMNAALAAEKLRAKISEHDFHNIGKVTVSMGVAEMSGRIQSIEELINDADEKLYKAKQQGRDRVVVL